MYGSLKGTVRRRPEGTPPAAVRKSFLVHQSSLTLPPRIGIIAAWHHPSYNCLPHAIEDRDILDLCFRWDCGDSTAVPHSYGEGLR